jgi:hypothetical protein
MTRSHDGSDQGRVASGLNILAGLWLIVSSFLFGGLSANAAAAWNSVTIGIAIAVFAAIRLLKGANAQGLSWLNAVLGAWMIIAPSVFGYPGVHAWTWSNVITGVVVIVMALVSAAAADPEAARAWPASWWPSGRRLPWYDVGMPYGASTAPGGFRGVGPRGYRRSDESIRDELCNVMAQHPDLDAGDIDVRVVEGAVTLSGSVPDRHARRLAEDIVGSIGGVSAVRNELRVRSSSVTDGPRRVA